MVWSCPLCPSSSFPRGYILHNHGEHQTGGMALVHVCVQFCAILLHVVSCERRSNQDTELSQHHKDTYALCEVGLDSRGSRDVSRKVAT